MQKFMSLLEEKLIPIANKIASNRCLSAISTGFSLIMPILIIGAIFSLLSGMQIGVYQEFIKSTSLAQYLVIPSKITTDLLSLYAVFAIAYAYTSRNGLPNEGHIAGFLALMSFLIITPIQETGEGMMAVKMLPFNWLGSAGLFMAIIVGLLTGIGYNFIVKKKWTIKLPDGVPPTIAKSFSALIPGFIIAVVFLIISACFKTFAAVDPHTFLYGLISAPLAALSGSVWTYMLFTFLASLLWFFGLHGGMIVMPFSMMLFMQAGIANQTAYLAGQEMTNIITTTSMAVTMLGGIGATLSLTLLMTFTAKSSRYRTLGKLSLAPGICGINEPIMFGFPIILNPVMAIPFFIVPLIDAVIMYFSMSLGFVGLPRIAMAAMGTPVFMDAFLIVGFSGVILQLILIPLNMLIYYPFFKLQDRLAYDEEHKGVELAQEE